MDVVRFLIGPGADISAYAVAATKVEGAVEELYRHGRPATKLSLGAQVKAVEDLTRQYLGCKHASFVVNWTAGYDIALDLAGVRGGDEVIIPAITFIATAAPALRKGARVVFADVQRDTVNLDPVDVARKITPRTKAIVPVHIGGYPVDMEPLMELARQKGIAVIEDAAHGFGGTYHGRKLGTIGDFGAYSFHEVKNITALGEGGIVVTNSELGAQFAKARFCGFDLETPPPRTWLYNISPIYSRTATPSFPPISPPPKSRRSLCSTIFAATTRSSLSAARWLENYTTPSATFPVCFLARCPRQFTGALVISSCCALTRRSYRAASNLSSRPSPTRGSPRSPTSARSTTTSSSKNSATTRPPSRLLSGRRADLFRALHPPAALRSE